MNRQSIETAMRDCGVPGRVVEVRGRLIKLTLLNEAEEKLEVQEVGFSEFADLVLEWCGRVLHRAGLRHPSEVRSHGRQGVLSTAESSRTTLFR